MLLSFHRKVINFPSLNSLYFGQLIDGSENVEKTGFAPTRISQDNDKFSLFDVERNTSEGCHTFQSKEGSFVNIFSFDNVVRFVGVCFLFDHVNI